MPPVRCRQIVATDIETVVALLSRGFPRKQEFWLRAMRRLGEHPTPPGVPKYGYLLEHNRTAVGSLLLIHSSIVVNGLASIRCFVSSFYVDPVFRPYAALLESIATARKDVTYFNVTPLPHTWPLLKALGFVPYSRRRGLRSAHLTYCRDQEDFIRFAGPLGRYLARRGVALVSLDANGPISGLIGAYRGGRPKYFKGPEQSRLGDEAYSERVLFGF
jgi:hypothetical protein